MNHKPQVLILCERSGMVRDAFLARGIHASSVDLFPTDSSLGDEYNGLRTHWVGDALDVARVTIEDGQQWDAMIAFPDCTYLSGSGLHWNGRTPGRAEKTEAALQFVQQLWELPIRLKALENPVGCINSRLPFMPRPQYIQPYEFGDDASKRTGLWLDGLPPLEPLPPDQQAHPRIVEYPPGSGKWVRRWSNQTDSGQNRLGPSADRARIRGTTYPGIARAMAAQWAEYLRSV